VDERRIYDITRPITSATPVWPGDPAPELEWFSQTSSGDAANASAIRMSVHTGTHADAPYHVDGSGPRIGEIPANVFVGAARLVDVRGVELITAEVARRVIGELPWPRRILFRTGAWSHPTVFPTRFPSFAAEAADVLNEAGVLLVGTDAPSVDAFSSTDLPAHRSFAGAGTVILENLLLDDVAPGDYELIALPLRLLEADGSPVRAILLRR